MLEAVSGFVTWDFIFVRADPGQSELNPAFVEALNKDLNFILRAGAAQVWGLGGCINPFSSCASLHPVAGNKSSQDPRLSQLQPHFQATYLHQSAWPQKTEHQIYRACLSVCVCFLNETRSFDNNWMRRCKAIKKRNFSSLWQHFSWWTWL